MSNKSYTITMNNTIVAFDFAKNIVDRFCLPAAKIDNDKVTIMCDTKKIKEIRTYADGYNNAYSDAAYRVVSNVGGY